MRRIYALFLALIAGMVLVGCGKDFLDPQEHEHVTEKQLQELLNSPLTGNSTLRTQLDGIYNLLYSDVPYSAHWRYGFRSTLAQLDAMGCDLIPEDFDGVFAGDYKHIRLTADNTRLHEHWVKLFHVVGAVNSLFVNFTEDFAKKGDAEVKLMYAEALTLRAIAYYYLTNLFQMPWEYGKNLPCVPLVRDQNSDIKVRATVSELYDFMISDLHKALEYSTLTATKTDADASVTATYLAKLYMERGNYADALIALDLALDRPDIVATSLPNAYTMDFVNLQHENMLWGYDVTSDNTLVFASFSGWYSQNVDGYASLGLWNQIWNVLYEKIQPTDARYEWFSPGFGDVTKEPNKTAYAEFVKKWGGGLLYSGDVEYVSLKHHANPDFTGDVVFLRAADPYLLRMEARLEQGDVAKVRAELAEFMKVRDPKFDVSKIEEGDLKAFVRLQRRIELWGEGVSWFDIRRWGEGFDRTLKDSKGETNHYADVVKIPANSPIFAFCIPQKEIDNTPSYEPQNTPYTPTEE